MALAASDAFASFDDTTGHLDISPVLHALLKADTATLGLIGMGAPYLKRTHYFNQQALNDNTVAGNNSGELSATATSYIVSDASKIRVGALLMDQAAGKVEVVQVTAISTNTLTITRGYGSTDGETHATDATWTIVAQPVQQGDETVADISNVPTQVTQYGQGFKRTVKLADEMIAEARNGVFPGITDYFNDQMLRRTLEMKVEANASAILGIGSPSSPSDTVYGTMKGLREFITASGGNSTAAAGAALSETLVNNVNYNVWDDGGQPDTLLFHGKQTRQFQTINKDRIRIAPSEQRIGFFATRFLTDLGNELEMHTDRWFKQDEAGIIDVKGFARGGGIELSALKGRELMVEPLAKDGSARKSQVVADWSVRVFNATKAHGWLTGLAVPA